MSGLREWEHYDDAMHVISLGAGRQSSVMYLMAVAGEIEPTPRCAIFADTGNEPPWVYEQLDYLMQYDGVVPIYVVGNGNIYDDSMAALNGGPNPWGAGRWVGPPAFSDGGGPIRRKCTQHYKIKPKEDKIRALLKETGAGHVVDWRGHTIDEIQRAKPDKRKYYVVRWPLLEARMSDHDCARWLEAHGHPQFKWSACEVCPFRLAELDKAKALMEVPGTRERIAALDEEIRDMSRFGLDNALYLNASYLPVTEFVKLNPNGNQPALFDCDGGVCGL